MAATTLNAVLARMSDLAQQSTDRTCLTMLYGPSGVGKTSLAMWLAQELRVLKGDEGRIIMFDSAQGYVSLDDSEYLRANVDRIGFREYGDLVAVADAIRTKKARFKNARVIVIDEIDSISNDVLNRVVRDKHNTPDDEPTPEIEGSDHAPMAALMMTALNGFVKQGLHVILVAHDNKRMTDSREITEPSLSPKYKNRVMQLMHVVGLLTAQIKLDGTYKRQVQALPSSLVEAKTRAGSLKEKVKFDHDEFVSNLVAWVQGSSIAEDLNEVDSTNLADDVADEEQTPTDMVEDDDAPAYVE